MSEATFNPFDPVTSTAEPQQTTATEPTTVEPQTSEPAKAEPSKNDVQQPEVKPFEWNNDFAKTVYDKLVSKDISELADMLYEQKVLSNLDSMSDEDVVKLHMAYQYPDLTPDEIEEEFNAKYKVENRIDEDSMTEDEIAQARRQMEKEQKSLNRELKKLVREAKDGLSDMKKDIDFPDILSQIQQASQQPVSDDAISQILAKQQEEQSCSPRHVERL